MRSLKTGFDGQYKTFVSKFRNFSYLCDVKQRILKNEIF